MSEAVTRAHWERAERFDFGVGERDRLAQAFATFEAELRAELASMDSDPAVAAERKYELAKLEAYDSIEAMVLTSEDEEVEPDEVWERVAKVLRAQHTKAELAAKAELATERHVRFTGTQAASRGATCERRRLSNSGCSRCA